MSWTGSELAGIAADRRALDDGRNLQSWMNAYAKLEAEHAESLSITAGIQAVRRSSEAVLRAHWPTHPLFTTDVKQRVYDAGKRAWALTKDWDAVFEAGTTFRLPDFDYEGPFVVKLRERCAVLEGAVKAGEQDLRFMRSRAESAEQQLVEAKQQIQALEARVTALLGVESRLQQGFLDANKDCCQHLAQSAAFRAQLEFADPSNPLVTDPGLRQRLAASAWETLMQSNGDWNAVRQLGRSFLSRQEASRHSSDLPGEILVGQVDEGEPGEFVGDLQPDGVDRCASDMAPALADPVAPDALDVKSGE